MSRILWDQLAAMNTHYFHYPFEYFLETQKEFSIKKLELWGAVPHLWIDHTGYESPAGLLAQAKELGMDFAAHTPRPYGYSLCVPAVSYTHLRHGQFGTGPIKYRHKIITDDFNSRFM